MNKVQTSSTTAAVLSDKLQPKRLKQGTYRMYKLVMKDEVDRNAFNVETGQNERPVNPFYYLDGTAIVFDKHEADPTQAHKTIRNVINVRTSFKDGETVKEEVIEPVVFSMGVIVVSYAQYNTYAFLERHNGNKANPYRDPTARVIFEPVEAEKEKAELLNDLLIENEAMQKALSIGIEEARSTADKLGMIGWESMDVKELRYDLSLKAKANPRGFIMATRDIPAKVKIQARDVIATGAIYCDTDINSWKWGSNIDADFKKNETICEFTVDKNPEQTLIEYLLSGTKESKKVYEKFVEIIKNPEDYIG